MPRALTLAARSGPQRPVPLHRAFFALLCLCSAVSACSGSSSPSGTDGGTAFSAGQLHCLDKLNEYRAEHGAGALALDAKLNAFALEGSQKLSAGGPPHGNFQDAGTTLFQRGFCGAAGENQAPGYQGIDENSVIDKILADMMAEGPGGGHYENIIKSSFALVGVGLVWKDKALYFTNDFSNACR